MTIKDAPHTGARLETYRDFYLLSGIQMPPTRGHDLKQCAFNYDKHGRMMPPTRGHDLKHWYRLDICAYALMPPTRGHDLKQPVTVSPLSPLRCPPHGGTT